MTEPFPTVTVEAISLPVAHAAAAERAAGSMRDEMTRLWQQDRAAGLHWATSLDRLTVAGEPSEGPDALGRRLARVIRSRLVQGQRP